VPAALCCRQSASQLQPQSEGAMVDCPMHHDNAEPAEPAEPSCPLHSAKPTAHECHCPTIGCSQTDNGFMALFGPIGMMPAPTFISALHLAGDATPASVSSAMSLAAVPLSPPPRG
jgi:hypothetical protein